MELCRTNTITLKFQLASLTLTTLNHSTCQLNIKYSKTASNLVDNSNIISKGSNKCRKEERKKNSEDYRRIIVNLILSFLNSPHILVQRFGTEQGANKVVLVIVNVAKTLTQMPI